MTPDEFYRRWKDSGGAELANSQSFLKELCDLIGVPQPNPTLPDTTLNRYVFEKTVEFNNGDGSVSSGRIDLYRAGCFVLESKQGSERKAAEQAEALATVTKTTKKLAGTAARGTAAWEKAMQAARKQAKGYAEAIPDEWPPFLIVADIGFCIDLYADFSGSGKNYIPFPDPKSYRIFLERVSEESVREMLRTIWVDPHSLDPSKLAANVTRDIAARLAKLAKSLERQHDPQTVAGFLMRCLFTMFAEDVELIRKDSFKELLLSLRTEPHNFAPMVEALWEAMDRGTFSTVLREKLRHFNGKFFKDKTALPLTLDQLELLIEAAKHKWQYVEPAIFGTLLERALDPIERHKLGAHYTPRAYVERLVMPTVIEPLREQWDATYAAAVQLDEEGKRKEAIKLLRDFHGMLCEICVLDPACGSGNFLYVSMELMKRLEGEVISALAAFSDNVLHGITIDPHQFRGIEINPRAAALAELVLWIGFIQWHRRTRNEIAPPEPILRDYKNIECRDALLDWDSIDPVLEMDGSPVTRWDGRTYKPHPVTQEEVPDEEARVPELNYIDPRKGKWPDADYIVGNPPFIVKHKMLSYFGDGYVKALRLAYSGSVPDSADYVMYWWRIAAELVVNREVQRFGFITTNSISQVLNRRVIQSAMECSPNFKLSYAIPDHPWVNSEDGAAVRIAMTVACLGSSKGVLDRVISERVASDGIAKDLELQRAFGTINPKLTIGVDVSSASPLTANGAISNNGVMLGGRGFLVPASADVGPPNVIKDIRNGNDILQRSRNAKVIDFWGLSVREARDLAPIAFQQILNSVKPKRDANRRPSRRDNWWIFSETMPRMRRSIAGLSRYIGVPETGVHRVFVFVPSEVLPEHPLIALALDDAFFLGVLSSSIHIAWSLAAGGTLEDRPRYNKSVCFETFPFPQGNEQTLTRIRELAEKLDAHRKRQQEKYPCLTITGVYNVLEKLRSGAPLTAKELLIHDHGLVSILKQIHDDLDDAVHDAYGWPRDLDDEEVLRRLLELNRACAEEERQGVVRWLRPEFQNASGAAQAALSEINKNLPLDKAKKSKTAKLAWPETLPDRVVAVQAALKRYDTPVTANDVAAYYSRARKADVAELLETLVAVGNIRRLADGRYVAYK